MTEKKDVLRSCNIQFFHNLHAINFRMRHDRERKDVLYHYVTLNSFTTYTLYKFQNETYITEKKCVELDHAII